MSATDLTLTLTLTNAQKTNFIQQPLPKGSHTGAGGLNGQSGALGLGQRASTGIGTFNSFWYVFPVQHPGIAYLTETL